MAKKAAKGKKKGGKSGGDGKSGGRALGKLSPTAATADGGGGAWRKVGSKEDSGVGRRRDAAVRDFAAEGQLSDQFE